MDGTSMSGGSKIRDWPISEPGSQQHYRSTPAYAAAPWRALRRRGVAVGLYRQQHRKFDKSIAEFARAYADQTERDWRALLDAIATGRIAAEPQAAAQPP